MSAVYVSGSCNGTALTIESASISRSIGGGNGSGRITAIGGAAPVGGTVTIAAGHDTGAVVFTGIVAGSTKGLDGKLQIDARDRLERMRFAWGGTPRVYQSAGTVHHDDASIIRNFLEAYAIPSTDANIQSSFLGELAVVQPIRLDPGSSPDQLIRQLDDLACYTTFPRADGNIYRRPLATGAGTAYTITEGSNLISGSRSITRDGVANRCQVTGLEYVGTAVGGSAAVTNSSIPSPPGYVTKEISSNLLETAGQAGSVASAQVACYGANRDRFEGQIVGTAAVDLGYTITVTSATLGSPGAYFVTGIEHNISRSGFITTVRGEKFG